MTTVIKKPKRSRLTNMVYDEISLVDKGANQHAHVVIVKRDSSVQKAREPEGASAKSSGGVGTMPKNRKADYYNSKKAKNPSARSSSWDDKKHPRKGAGSPAGGEFDKTSQESKDKYGKDGTTKAKQDAKKSSKSYTVKKGDTLWALAEKYYGDGTQWKKIAKANGVTDPKKLPIGKKLTIPGVTDKTPDTKKKTSTAKPKYRKVMEPGGRVHDERVKEPHPKKKSPPAKKKTVHRRRRKKKSSEVKKLLLHNMFMNYTGRG